MGSPQYKSIAGNRTDRQVLWAGGYILAMVATILVLSKGGVINTTGVRLWLYSQPALLPPCTGRKGGNGGPQSRDCLRAAAEEHEQQGRLREAAALGDGPPGVEKAGQGEENAGDTAAEEVVRQQLEAAAEATRLHQKQQRRELEREAAEAEAEKREEEEAAAARAEKEGEKKEKEEGKEEEEQQQQGVQNEYSGPSPYQKALASCDDLDCLTQAAEKERWPGQFLFPHFFIVGWQKCATTSLFWHLDRSPQVLTASNKEPEFFSYECGYDPASCTAKSKKYIWKTMLLEDALEADLRVAAVEASTHYGRNGHILAPGLRQAFPWLKIVVSLREPISRSISMLAHNLDKHETGCLTKADTYNCLSRDLERGNFSQPLQGWLQAYPAEQVYLIQYENLTSSAGQSEVLHGLKRYLGIDPELPDSDLGMRNTREIHLQRKGALERGQQAEGWPMKRWQYEALVKQVRPDALRVAELATEYGLADGKQWMRDWEEEWRLTLEECDGNGDCIVFPN